MIHTRRKEIQKLTKIIESDRAELLAVYGRRRIGKTHLIHQFFSDRGLYFEMTGIKGATLNVQLSNFTEAFSDCFGEISPSTSPKSWFEAFTLLRKKIAEVKGEERIILFFDELPWLARRKSGFLEAFEHFWNRYMSRDKRIILVICGSAAAWMIKKVLNARGGLHGRVTQTIRLLPFTLHETEEFLKSRHVVLNHKQLVEVYMAFGGVAQYLLQIERGKSSAQIIQDVCFSQSGYLMHEFHRLYASLFDNYESHIAVIRLLAKHSMGLTRESIIKGLKWSSGGGLSKILIELEESGFILGVPSFGKKKALWGYRLIDPFSLFYLRWMDFVNGKLGELEADYWNKQQGKQSFACWAGYAFENVCLMHTNQIKRALGLGAVTTRQSQWRSKEAQVDLVIDREDNCMNLCEMKFYRGEFVMTKNEADKVEKRKLAFAETTKTRKALFTTLITSYGVSQNAEYLRVVDQHLSLESLFRYEFVGA